MLTFSFQRGVHQTSLLLMLCNKDQNNQKFKAAVTLAHKLLFQPSFIFEILKVKFDQRMTSPLKYNGQSTFDSLQNQLTRKEKQSSVTTAYYISGPGCYASSLAYQSIQPGMIETG